MSESRIVSPQDAQDWLDARAESQAAGFTLPTTQVAEEFAHTVATEPDRIRAAVVKALRDISPDVGMVAWRNIQKRADAFENGVDL